MESGYPPSPPEQPIPAEIVPQRSLPPPRRKAGGIRILLAVLLLMVLGASVLLNLLLNAVQAMPNEVGHITITAAEDKRAKQVEIMVKDSGSGVSEEHLAHIFDPFFSTKEVGYGTGLGLSVAHGVVERHGGTLTVKSKLGEGSVFTIRLPLSFDPTLETRYDEAE